MNRLVMLAVTGFFALLLTACGENNSSKPAPVKTDATVTVPAENNATKSDDSSKTMNTGTEQEQKSSEQSH